MDQFFRYDRPQKGRQRQFNQFNFEIIGQDSFLSDVESIVLAIEILEKLNILSKTTLQINSLGCFETKNKYQNALKEYFTKYKNELSEDSRYRLAKNPLRILDSKDENDIKIVKDAPQINNFYSSQAKERFENILKSLDNFGASYQVNSRLVRGLDYYTSTVFEFTTNELGAQNTVLAGGRYDDLISKMGGQNLPAIGFAGGIERLMLLSDLKTRNLRPVFIIYVSKNEQEEAFQLANRLRKSNIYAQIIFDANMKKQMKKATLANSKFVIIIGDEELKSGQFTVKDFDAGSETKIAADQITKYFQ